MTSFPDVPAVGLYLDRYHRYFFNQRGPLPSVTTITGVIDKPFLVSWAANMTASLAVSRADSLLGHLMGHVEAPVPDCEACLPGQDVVPWDAQGSAQRWLASASTKHRDSAADVGKRLHAYAEAETYGVETVIPEAEQPAFDAYRRWRDEYRPEELEAEFAVISLRHQYGGTGDLLARIRGSVVAVDYKSGKSVPDDIDLQLSGYSRADGIALPNTPDLVPLPRVERHAVLHIRPDLYPGKGYDFRYVPVTPVTFERFLDARRLYDWKKAKDAEYRRRKQEERQAA